MQEQSLELRQGPGTLMPHEDPVQIVEEAKRWADTLIAIAKATDLVVDDKYLKVEAWQTIARFNRCIIDTGWTKPILDASGGKLGYEAQARLRRLDNGLEIGTAEASCLFDEELERRDGEVVRRFEDDYACKSMAQTRAQGKMGRMAYAWVAVLAGYAPTPAEEMEGVAKPRAPKGAVFPFDLKGVDLKLKGRMPSELSAAELHAILPRWQDITTKGDPKYREGNQRLVTAIKEAIAEKTAPAQGGQSQGTSADPGEGARQPLGASPRDSTGFPGRPIPPAEAAKAGMAGGPPGIPLSPGSIVTPLDEAWIKVDELLDAKGRKRQWLPTFIKDTWPEVHPPIPRSLSLLQVQALAQYLSTLPDAKL